MILEIFQHHNNQMEALVGREFAPATLTKYKTCLSHTRSFIETKYGKKDPELENLNFEFISESSFSPPFLTKFVVIFSLIANFSIFIRSINGVPGQVRACSK